MLIGRLVCVCVLVEFIFAYLFKPIFASHNVFGLLVHAIPLWGLALLFGEEVIGDNSA